MKLSIPTPVFGVLLLAALALLHSTNALAGANGDTRIPLHAVVQSLPPPPPVCEVPDPCPDPLVEVDAGSMVRAYLLLRNYDSAVSVQTAFDWGDWTFHFGNWSCQSNQISATVPDGKGGPVDGTIATAFDCIIGGSTAVIGWMQFTSGTSCLTQVESAFSLGNTVLSCDYDNTSIIESNWGSICSSGRPGVNACDGNDNGTSPNDFASLPMHAVVLQKPPPEPCAIADPCDPGPPLVDVPPNSNVTTYVVLHGYDNVSGLQTAFEWDNWTFFDGSWSCLSGQLTIHTPTGLGGPNEGTLATIFDCIVGGSSAVVGSMNLTSARQGCLTQVESIFPLGTHVIDCGFNAVPVAAERRGSICVGAGGVDACGDRTVPVESATWGEIKASFR